MNSNPILQKRIELLTDQMIHAGNDGLLAGLVVQEAALFYQETPEDFQISKVGRDRIEFGKENVLIWTPMGFRIEHSTCTAAFVRVYQMKMLRVYLDLHRAAMMLTEGG